VERLETGQGSVTFEEGAGDAFVLHSCSKILTESAGELEMRVGRTRCRMAKANVIRVQIDNIVLAMK
jgi:hypothetical protein